ncbi:unnamed protein product [Adineta steineri]|uniref:P-type Ca(2+) transporter n=1 Tax=Adineta steineri TaxID=433720 RepID=A0A814ZXG2_9BILA|nr:unnamed protein product [Adineta steineri]CAF4051990.1 unnamed protein product [Adineta steineri]
MILSAIIIIVVGNGGDKPSNWEVFIRIVVNILTNAVISFITQRNVEYKVKGLMQESGAEAKVKQNGEWEVIDAAELVPSDIIGIRFGDVVPADSRLITIMKVILIDQATFTGESLPVNKLIDDEIFAGSVCQQGEAAAIVIGTGLNILFGRINMIASNVRNRGSHLQQILRFIGNYFLIIFLIFVIAKILVMCAGFHYNYRRGVNNLFVILLGYVSLAMTTVLSVILAVAIEELASVTILCTDKTGTLTLNKLSIDKSNIKKYSDVEIDDIIHYAAIASQMENQDAIDACIIEACDDVKKIREDIKELEFKSFDSIDKRTEITYRMINDGSLHRISTGLRALPIAIEDISSGHFGDEGNGFKLIGLLPIYDSLCLDTKEAIEQVLKLGVTTKIITGNQLAITKEIGRCLGIGDNIFSSEILTDGPSLESAYRDIDDIILHADGFAGVYPEHKSKIIERLQNLEYGVAMIGDGVNDAPALSKANVVGFSILVFAFKFDVRLFMVFILAVLNDSALIAISNDRVYPSSYPNSQALIFIIRSRSFFFIECPSLILVGAFILAQLIATFIAVYANWNFTNIAGCGWSWAGIVWVWNIIWFFSLDFLKFGLRAYFEPLSEKRAITETLLNNFSTNLQETRRSTMSSGDDAARIVIDSNIHHAPK